MKPIFVFLSVFFAFPLFASDYNQTRNLSLSATGIKEISIDCGAGYLKISGSKTSNEIKVKAKIEIDEDHSKKIENFLEKHLKLSLKEKGNRVELVSLIEKSGSFFSILFDRNLNVKIDLNVEIPEKMDVVVDDGAGLIEIHDIEGEIQIDDGQGNIEVHHTKGRLEIDDGGGDIDIENVTGEISIDDGSGGIIVKNIQGDLTIDDGAGEINVKKIGGTLHIDDGSGSIRINGVDEDVVIENSGSGSVSIQNVMGNVHRYDD